VGNVEALELVGTGRRPREGRVDREPPVPPGGSTRTRSSAGSPSGLSDVTLGPTEAFVSHDEWHPCEG
jgi:hypothetical protein